MNFDNIPNELRIRPNWVLWKIENRKSGLTKVPYSTKYFGRASSVDSNTWDVFENALKEYKNNTSLYNGIGFVISVESGLIFIDIDHCINSDGELDERAADILNAFQTEQYIEISQSGTGIHIITKGKIPNSFKNSTNGVEMYSDKRFVAMTGNTISASEPNEEQSALDYIFNRYKTAKKVNNIHSRPKIPLMKDDKKIIEYASRREKKFPLLFSGKWADAGYNSQSEADAGLCVILAFWTDCDINRMDNIFRSSGLYRAKWEREDYRNNTLKNACCHCSETITEFIKRRRSEEIKEYEKVFLSEW